MRKKSVLNSSELSEISRCSFLVALHEQVKRSGGLKNKASIGMMCVCKSTRSRWTRQSHSVPRRRVRQEGKSGQARSLFLAVNDHGTGVMVAQRHGASEKALSLKDCEQKKRE